METTTHSGSLPSVQEAHRSILELKKQLAERIIGQQDLILKLLITLLSDGHLLVEGAPGLAKTTSIKALAEGIHADFHRIQFTPDLLPADLTGTDVYRHQEGTFVFQPGPLFHSIILADEINRAPAKVQSALLEAMGERQITIGQTTYPLSPLFMVMATQNPIEQEGTYPLPEAQLDRFLMYVRIDYPDSASEQKILQLNRSLAKSENTHEKKTNHRISSEQIFTARKALFDLHLSEKLEEYIVQLVMATRNPKPYHEKLATWIRYGASPRASMGIDRASRAHAWLSGRDYVSPEDIHAVVYDILRHRILLSFEAEAEGMTPDHVISELLNFVAVP